MKVTGNQEYNLNIISIIEELQEKYDTIYWDSIDGIVYIYKPCGRRDFNEIIGSASEDSDKEEELLKRTLLYPAPTDEFIEEMKAGVFNRLVNTVMEESHLRDEDMLLRVQITNAFRAEMFDMQHQVTCVIHEAFPEFKIEEIENWGIEKTSKYLTRAEWILQNLRGFPIDEELAESAMAGNLKKWNELKEEMQKEVTKEVEENKPQTKKMALTPEKLAELEAQYPDIDWANDSINQMGEHALNDSFKQSPATESMGYR